MDDPPKEGATAQTTTSPPTTTPTERARSASPAKSEKEEGEVTGSAPLPTEAVPDYSGWQWVYSGTAGWYWAWDHSQQCYVWYDSATMAYTYTAPIPYDHQASSSAGAPGTSSSSPVKRPHGGYNPAIHGDYDPNADYAIEARREEEEREAAAQAASAAYAAQAAAAAGYQVGPAAGEEYDATAHFNRFTGRFQNPDIRPENFNDDNKSRRQQNAFFDVDAAANSHNGRSLRAERRQQRPSKKMVKFFNDRKKKRQDQKRRQAFMD